MNPQTMFLCGLLGLGIALFLIPLVLRMCRRMEAHLYIRDLHHTHHLPVPRLGGLALIVAFLLTALAVTVLAPTATQNPHTEVIVLGAVAMFLLGLADDLKPIGAKKKFLLQILIATAVWYWGVRIEHFREPFFGSIINFGWASLLVTVVWLVAMTNLINLIDGADGLAAGICLMLMGLLAYMGSSSMNLALVACGMVGALVGFLCYNFPPAKIYMGDGGAYFLGFLIGMMSIAGSQKGTVAAALIAPLFVLALPITDTALAMTRRGLRGLPLFRPDRKHIHHRLADMGLSRRKVVLSVYGITLVFLLLGWGMFWSQGRWFPVLLGLLVLILLICARSLSFSREWFSVGRVLGNSLEMRQEIQFALALNRWLELQGERSATIENLWDDYVFLGRKLGFSHLKLSLEDGARVWADEAHNSEDPDYHYSRHELQHGQAGILEIRACPCRYTGNGRHRPPRCGIVCPCAANSDLFEILSELAAEGWLKAAQRWQKRHELPIRFDSKPAELYAECRRARPSRDVAPQIG